MFGLWVEAQCSILPSLPSIFSGDASLVWPNSLMLAQTFLVLVIWCSILWKLACVWFVSNRTGLDNHSACAVVPGMLHIIWNGQSAFIIHARLMKIFNIDREAPCVWSVSSITWLSMCFSFYSTAILDTVPGAFYFKVSSWVLEGLESQWKQNFIKSLWKHLHSFRLWLILFLFICCSFLASISMLPDFIVD